MEKGHELGEQEKARQQSLAYIRETAGDGPPTFGNALRTVTFSELGSITQVPCARNALLYGVGAGVVVGAAKFGLAGARSTGPRAALNYGALAFAAVSLASFEACRFSRHQERSRMKYAVDRVEIKRSQRKSQQDDQLEQ
ncbi:hypothetical protein PYCC9005_002254 [Savitreella phatthalungensis]